MNIRINYKMGGWTTACEKVQGESEKQPPSTWALLQCISVIRWSVFRGIPGYFLTVERPSTPFVLNSVILMTTPAANNDF